MDSEVKNGHSDLVESLGFQTLIEPIILWKSSSERFMQFYNLLQFVFII